MSRLLKSGDERLGGVSTTVAARLPSAAEAERDKLQREIQRLHRELGLRDAELAQMEGDVERAFKDGEAKGRAIGLREAEDDTSKRLALLQAGIEVASTDFETALAGLEGLSAELAWLGVHKVLGSQSDRPDLVREIVHNQLQRLGKRAVVWVEVSSEDFSPEQSPQLTALAAGSPIQIRVSDDLAGGGCRIKLVLGGIDVGLGRQMAQLRSALSDLVGEAADL